MQPNHPLPCRFPNKVSPAPHSGFTVSSRNSCVVSSIQQLPSTNQLAKCDRTRVSGEIYYFIDRRCAILSLTACISTSVAQIAIVQSHHGPGATLPESKCRPYRTSNNGTLILQRYPLPACELAHAATKNMCRSASSAASLRPNWPLLVENGAIGSWYSSSVWWRARSHRQGAPGPQPRGHGCCARLLGSDRRSRVLPYDVFYSLTRISTRR